MKEEHPDKRYLELAEKWLNGTITQAEAEEYAAWYNSIGPHQVLHVPPGTATNKEEHRKKLLQSINRKRGKKSARIITLYKLAAAAIIITIIGAAWWYIDRSQMPATTVVDVAPPVVNDIQPGTNGAILTLANGQTIVLDTAGNGRLLGTGSADITKSNGSVAFTALQKNNPLIIEYNTLVTPRARQQQLQLSDGTKVWLNAESSIKFPAVFAGRRREVEVTGEVYMEVAKLSDKGKRVPFIVHAQDMDVEVLGTHFNINAYANEEAVTTTLLEGSVRVVERAAANSNWQRAMGVQQSIILKPGQAAQLQTTSEPRTTNRKLQTINNVDVELAVAWKNGLQAFSGADIKTIMRQVERWYDIEVEYKGNIPVRTFTGDIPRSANLSELLKLFEAASISCSIDAAKKKLTLVP